MRLSPCFGRNGRRRGRTVEVHRRLQTGRDAFSSATIVFPRRGAAGPRGRPQSVRSRFLFLFQPKCYVNSSERRTEANGAPIPAVDRQKSIWLERRHRGSIVEIKREQDHDQDFVSPNRDLVDQTALAKESVLHVRVLAMIQAGRFHGVELDPDEFSKEPEETTPSAAALSLWAQNAGMWSRAVRIRWRQLLKLTDSGQIVLLFTDGSAALMTSASPTKMVIQLKDPFEPAGAPSVEVDELRLAQVWVGEAVLLRAARGTVPMDRLFNLRWLVDLVVEGAPVASRYRDRVFHHKFLDCVSAAGRHDHGQQSAPVPRSSRPSC